MNRFKNVLSFIVLILLTNCNTPAVSDESDVKKMEEKANEEFDYSDKPVDPDYKHPSAEAHEKWLDRKFGMRIHWGIYSQLGLDASWPTVGASDEFKGIYSTLWQVFNPVEFNADEWAQLAEDAGMKYFVFTTKHADGFSMYDTKTTVNVKMRKPIGKVQGIGNIIDTNMHYSMMETMYKKDIVRQVVDAFRKKNMGIGFYYCNTDWNDINQRFEKRHLYYDSTYALENNKAAFEKAIARQTEQLIELCSNYGVIDQIDFDHGLPESLWKEIATMIKKARSLQPEALFRQRGLGKYGDFQTPEHWLPESPDDPRLTMPWQAIEHYGTRWAWQPNDTYNGKEWILSSLIDCASKGGNFMVGISPMANGKFDQRTQDDLRWVGRWLKLNGEAIYATRGMFVKESEFKFTRSKDSSTLYAFHTGWFANKQQKLPGTKPAAGSDIYMLGLKKPLHWKQEGNDIVVDIPAQKPDCEYAYVLKIKVSNK